MDDFLALEYFINPHKRVFWLYLLSSFCIACIYFYFNKKALRFNISSKLWLHPSARLDYAYFFIGYLIKVFMLYPIIIGAKDIALFVNKYLYIYFDYYENTYFSYTQTVVLYTITLFLFSDFTRYILHRLLHIIPILWEFHKVHHSAKVLTPITFYRVHPVENILFGFRYSFSIGVVTGIFIYFFGAMINIYTVFGVNIFIFIFSLFGSNLRHSHIAFSYPKILEGVFISPKQHQIHHSKKYFDKNFGGYLAIWDRIFGTIKYSKDVKVLKFGLKKEQMNKYKSITNILFYPFKSFIIGGKV